MLRVRSNFDLALAVGTTMTCAEAAGRLAFDKRLGGPLRRELCRGRPPVCRVRLSPVST